ncbi:hypothetical protein ACFP81_04325 [Deinococcus lacus]|uniref:Uncharacterized protein n=1 Tax=Deinococcus lacus TaxID=392561 RepID=A0ABW1YAH8_9DEIO
MNNYNRTSYPSYEACMAASQMYVQQGLPYPCQWQQASTGVGFVYFGPWTYFSGGYTRVIGYDADGRPSRRGMTFDSAGRATGRFAAPKVTRGGFSTGSRGGGAVGTGPVNLNKSPQGGTGSSAARSGGAPATASPSSAPTRITVPGSGRRSGGSFGG